MANIGYVLRLFILVLYSLGPYVSVAEEVSSYSILSKSINYHDPDNQWSDAKIKVHIQEPRTTNPSRYSVVFLNNMTNAFSLHRNRNRHIASYELTKDGYSIVKLDNQIIDDQNIIEKYRLDKSMSTRYRDFYKFYYGLPMTLEGVKIIDSKQAIEFDNQQAYRISFQITPPLISGYWDVYFSRTDYRMLGVTIRFPDNPAKNELIIFKESVLIDSFNIPRFRHWYTEQDQTYKGSDLIIKSLDSEL